MGVFAYPPYRCIIRNQVDYRPNARGKLFSRRAGIVSEATATAGMKSWTSPAIRRKQLGDRSRLEMNGPLECLKSRGFL